MPIQIQIRTDADTDPNWHQNDADPHVDLTHVVDMLQSQNFFLLPVYNVTMFYLSHQR